MEYAGARSVATPTPSATLVLLRDSQRGIEVLIMRRHKDIKFCGGFWVFPGGAVEEQDQTDSPLQTAMNAAVRETEEEAGITANTQDLIPLSKWTTPEEAVALHRKQDIDMLPPTVISLLAVLAYENVGQALLAIKQQRVLDILPKVTSHNNELTMLYPGDHGYETVDAENTSRQHRCMHRPDGWHYINQLAQ